jgi:hypothetical protein
MPSPSDFLARGKIIRVENDIVVFNPVGTTYELHLVNRGALPTPSSANISCQIRGVARKIWTMASGGNFVTPILGTPRVVQGMVRYLDEKVAVIQAGVPFVVSLPADSTSFDLINGAVAPGVMINATLMPGATFELAREAVAQG